MVKVCLKCHKEFDEKLIDDPGSEVYPSCPDCWREWTNYAVMVMNEMRLDMSLPEHRKVLRKYEKVFFGLEKQEGELQKNPDKRPQQ